MDVPFTRDTELYKKLRLNDNSNLNGNGAASGRGKATLQATPPSQDWLPGNPAMPLNSPDIARYLSSELETPRLDRMFPYLWLVATPSSGHVSALHEQLLRGRAIVVTENPELHLVWVEDRIFIKPLPPFMLSYDFWSLHLAATTRAPAMMVIEPAFSSVRRAALGYMRTYWYLVRHESDFRIAQEEHLIPADVDFASFVAFTSAFRDVPDTAVSRRYGYGQLRLTRLNLWAKLALGQWVFYKVSWQYSQIFARYYAPLLFIFGTLSVILSAMQVGSQARPEWTAFLGVSAWFAVTSLVVAGGIAVFLIAVLLMLLLQELVFALRH